MKRFFTLLFLFFFILRGFASGKSTVVTTVDTVRVMLAMAVSKTQNSYDYNYFPFIVYLDNKYGIDSLHSNPGAYQKKLNDYYYKRYYLYSKLINPLAEISFDCIREEESGNWNVMSKLLFHSIYTGSDWIFPKDYLVKLEEYATQDPFYGPVQGLIDIYFLKQYNWDKLSGPDKKQLKALEDKFSNKLYSTYIHDKEWGYLKLFSLFTIRINNNPVADDVNTDELAPYFDRNTFMMTFKKDYEDKNLMNREGGGFTTSICNLCTLWLFSLNR
jgi:hypothetical protein